MRALRHQTDDRAMITPCPGLDGCDGPDAMHNCGSEIATESSVCWTSGFVRLEPLAAVRTA
jgi:hypothetical protein